MTGEDPNQPAENRVFMGAACGFVAGFCNALLGQSNSSLLGGGILTRYRWLLVAGVLALVGAGLLAMASAFIRRRRWTFDFVMGAILASVLVGLNITALVSLR